MLFDGVPEPEDGVAAAGPLAAGQRARAQARGRRSLRRPARGGDTLSTTIRRPTDTRFHGGAVQADEVDRRSLAAELRAAIEGEVRFDAGSRALYATDASNYRMPPIGVVVPRHVDELVEIHRVCREHGAPIVLRGGGTSLAGQGCNTAVLIDFSKYLHHILEIDPDRRIARVQPGCVLDHLRGARARSTASPSARTRPRTPTARSAGCSATTPAAATRCSRSSTGPGRASPTTSSSSRC